MKPTNLQRASEDDREHIRAEVHWFQEQSVGKVKFVVKEWLDES